MYEMSCRSDNRIVDRKDQAIGRVVALLPLLPVKELDALADRLHQKIRATPGLPVELGDAVAGTAVPHSPSTRQRRDSCGPERCVDLVGQ